MKKILLTGLIATSFLYAESIKKGSLDFFIGTTQFETHDKGISVGMDVKGEFEVFDNLFLGAGISAEIFDPGNVENLKSNLGLFIDIYPTVSYNLTDDLSLRALYGYSLGEFDGHKFDGKSYGFGMEYKFNSGFKTGLNYKVSDVEFINKNTYDVKRVNLSFSYIY